MSDGQQGREFALYPPILRWLQSYLEAKYPHAEVKTFDVHSVNLSDFIQREGYKKYFPQYASYEVKVDLVGLVFEAGGCRLVVVEVKDSPLALIHYSQILGYCRILKPARAFLIAPQGMAPPLFNLLKRHGRLDILEYEKNRHIHVCKWNASMNSIDNSIVVPPL